MDMTPLILSLKAATNCYASSSSNRNSHILSGGSYEKREKYRGCDLYPSYGAAAYSSRLFSVAPFWKKQRAWSMAYGTWNSGRLFSDRDGHCIGGGVLSAFIPYCKRRI